jgi:hypothetical protein
MGTGERRGGWRGVGWERTEQAGAHGGWVFAHAAEWLDLEGGALDLADFEVAVAGGTGGALEALRGEAEDGAERLPRAGEGAGCWAEGGHFSVLCSVVWLMEEVDRPTTELFARSRWICHGAGCRELGSLAGPRPKIGGVRSRVLPPCLSAIPVQVQTGHTWPNCSWNYRGNTDYS